MSMMHFSMPLASCQLDHSTTSTWAQCNKKIYGRNLRVFAKSYSVCTWQAFRAQSNDCGQARVKHFLLTQSGARERFFALRQAPGLTHKHQARLQRFTTDKHSSLLRKFVNYVHKKFHNIIPWVQCYKSFLFVTDKEAT